MDFGKNNLNVDTQFSRTVKWKDGLVSNVTFQGAPKKISLNIEEDFVKQILGAYFCVDPEAISFNFEIESDTQEVTHHGVKVASYTKRKATLLTRVEVEEPIISLKYKA